MTAFRIVTILSECIFVPSPKLLGHHILTLNSTIHGAARQAEYDSLFHVRTREVHTCDGCDATRSDNVNEMLGIRIISDANIMDDTVENALSRYFSDPTALLPSACCSSCKKDSSQSIKRTIIAAPEYLRIQIGLLQQVSKEKKG